MRVFAYRNLHRSVWSLANATTRRVIAHSRRCLMLNCEFHVGEEGRKRVLRERVKNVHAGVVGSVDVWTDPPPGLARLRYEPYTGASFTADGVPVCRATRVWLLANGQAYAEGAA